MIRIGALCLYLGFIIAVLIGFLVKPPSELPHELIYKYQDTIQFCDKETEEVQKTIKNAEFRILSKHGVVYGLKIKIEEKEQEQEVLIMDKIPPDCFVEITRDARS